MNKMIEHVVETSQKTLQKALDQIQGLASEHHAMYKRCDEDDVHGRTYHRAKAEGYDHAARILKQRIRQLEDLLPWEDLPF